MATTSPRTPDPDEAKRRTEECVKLLRRFFHVHYCPDTDIAQAQKPQVLPAYFCGWCDKHMVLLDADAECEAAEVPRDTWEYLTDLFASGVAPERIQSIWYLICLSDRPKPGHDLKAINVFAMLTWADGTISPVQAYMTGEMIQTPGQGFTDDLVAQIISGNARALVEQIASEPLDVQHDKASAVRYRSAAPEDAYEVMMGLIMSNIPKLKPELQDPVRNYMRLAQAIIRPVVPAQAYRAFKARGGQDKKLTGGWDDQ